MIHRFAVPIGGAVLAALLVAPGFAQETKPTAAPATQEAAEPGLDMAKVSYIMGTQMGESIRANGIDLDYEAYLQGIKDAIEEKEQPYSAQEKSEIMMKFQTEVRERMMREREAQATGNLEEAVAFLAENGEKDGVVTTESGLQYLVVEEGEGESPSSDSTVTVHYKGTLLDGTKFDSSYDRAAPAEFGVSQVIGGWTEGLQLMKKGSKYTFWIHPDQAYGKQGRPSIPPNSMLMFEVELIDFK